MSNEPLMTTREVCAYLRCHPNSIARWIAAGKLKPAAKVGRSYRFSRAELERFTAASTEAQPPEAAEGPR